MPASATKIWLPGVGTADIRMASLDAAAQEYDPILRFGRNEDTGQWCVFVVKRGMAPLPVLGFSEMPERDYMLRRIYEADSVRHGAKMLDDIERHNESLQEPGRAIAADAEEHLTETMEWAFRQQGATPYSRVHMNPNRRVIGGWS